MSTFRTDLTKAAKNQVAEKSRREITFTIRDSAEVILVGTALDFVKLTIYDEATGAIINSRTGIDELQPGNPTGQIIVGAAVEDNGKLILDPDDNPIVASPAIDSEVHVVQLDYQWDSDPKKIGRHLIRVLVVDLLKTT